MAQRPINKPKAGDLVESVDMVNVRKRQARAIETRASIISAATEEFAALGFNGATTRSIATRAEVPHNSVVYHFETKLGVWQAVMQQALSWYQSAFEKRWEGLRGVNPVETLRLLQADFIRTAATHPELHWLMSHEAGQGSDRLEWLIHQLLENSFEKWRGLILAAQVAQCYVDGDPLHLHYLFIGAAGRIFMLSAEVEKVLKRDPFDPDFVDEHIRLVNNLFFREPPRKSTAKRQS
jgi:AcrR family transcriptional regulator